jgi:flagellar biosynthesis/type III secretory pathway protein FliH
MVAAAGMELIKGSSIKETPDTPGFTRILSKQQQEESGEDDQFVRFMPDGSLSIFKKEKVEEVPQIDVEEVNKRRLEQLEREVYQKAFAEGEKTGIEIGQEKMEQEINRLIPQLESVLRELDNLPHRVFMASENFLVESLISFNRELLAHELTINPEGIADRVNRILENCIGRKDIAIRVSPSNAQILERIEHFEKLKIVSDPSIASGSVLMESDFGGMEDNLEARLREVETALRQQLQERLDQSGINDIADAAHQKAEDEINAELTPLVEDKIESEPVEQSADEKDSLEDDSELPLDSLEDDKELSLDSLEDDGQLPLESLADDDDTLDGFLDSVSEPQSDDYPLDSKAEDILDDLLGSSSESQSNDEHPDDSMDSFLDSDIDSDIDSNSDFIEQEAEVESSELAAPVEDDDEWLSLDEDTQDSNEADSFLEQDEPSTPTDEDQTE